MDIRPLQIFKDEPDSVKHGQRIMAENRRREEERKRLEEKKQNERRINERRGHSRGGRDYCKPNFP